MLIPRFTTEELAHLPEREALRRHFSFRNLRTLRWLSWIAVFGAFALAASRPSDVQILIGLVHFVATVVFAVGVRQALSNGSRFRVLNALGRSIHANARFVTMMFFLVEITAWISAAPTADPGPIIIVIFGAWILTLPRLSFGNLALLYGWLIASAIIEGILTSRPVSDLVAVIAAGGINVVMALLLALWLSRRAKAAFLAEWRSAHLDAVDQLRMREELEFAREIQLSMLPVSSPDLPWIEVASLSLPASEVGGDYYDYFPIDDDRLLVTIGDVAGHGLASGIVLSGIRAGLTVLAETVTSPLELMKRLHVMVRKTSRHRMIATLQLLLLDRRSSSLRIASAGHPPLLIRRDGDVRRVEIESLPLGTRLDGHWSELGEELLRGDMLVLQTDGLYEAADAEGNQYGFDRLERVVSDAGESAGEVRDAILRDLWSFRGAERQTDDVTIVVLRVV